MTRAAGGVVAVLLGVSACASAADGRLSPDAQVVEDYVEAMAAGDVDEAMNLRCPELQIDAGADRELFEDQLRRLRDDLGAIGVGRIELDDPDPLGAGDVSAWKYWLTVDGNEVDEPLVAFVGDKLICSLRTSHFLGREDRLSDALEVGEQAEDAALADLLPTAVGSGYRLIRDEAVDPDQLMAGATDGWVRQWQEDPFGGVTLAATRFPSGEPALRAAREDLERAGYDVLETISVPEVDGAAGVRVLGSAWLGIQPPTEGPYVDIVSLVAGDTWLYAAVCCPETGSEPSRVVALMQEMATLAA